MMGSDRARSQCEGATVRQFRSDNKGADARRREVQAPFATSTRASARLTLEDLEAQHLRAAAREVLRRRIGEILAEKKV
jgi:hypothetical protein